MNNLFPSTQIECQFFPLFFSPHKTSVTEVQSDDEKKREILQFLFSALFHVIFYTNC